MLEVRNVGKTYSANGKEVKALNKVNFNIDTGEIVCLLGHNGAGKTTLVKSLASLLIPDEGEIWHNGKSIYEDLSEYRRITSYLLGGERGLYNRLSGRDNIEYLAGLKGVFGKNLHRTIEAYFEELDMSKFIDQRVENYSRGMKQKVHLINALITNSEVLLLDEPTAGMDPVASKKTREFIKKIAQESNRKIIVTSHMMKEVEDLSDRILIINQGQLIFDDSIEYFKKKNRKITKCTCAIANDSISESIVEALESKYSTKLIKKNQGDKVELSLTGKNAKEIVTSYIDPLKEVLLELSFYESDLEDIYIEYIEQLAQNEIK